MTDMPEHLEALLNELGPTMDDVDFIVQDEPVSWMLHFEDDSMVHIAWRASPSRLELMCPVGLFDDETAMSTVKLLLMFNFLSKDTGGARMGLSAADDRAFLVKDLPASGLGLPELRDACRAFAAQAQSWRGVMAAAADHPASVASIHVTEIPLASV